METARQEEKIGRKDEISSNFITIGFCGESLLFFLYTCATPEYFSRFFMRAQLQ